MSKRLRRTAAGPALAAAALIVVGVLARFLPFPLDNNDGNAEVECGEMLLHGRPPQDFDVSYSMPLASISSAYLYGHAGREASRWFWAAAVAALGGLTFALGLLLGGWAAGAAALALTIPLFPELCGSPINTLYAIMVLLVAGALVRRGRAPTPVNAALLGLALGLSLLQRSPLIFFPLALAALEALPGRGPRAGVKGVLPILLVPALLLLPWIAMNWMLHGEFVMIERGRIDGLLLNSIKFVRHESGGAGLPGGGLLTGLGGALAAWARAALQDPASYLSSSFGRLAFIATRHPLLLLAAGAGLLLGRRRTEVRALGLLASYFIAIHCCLALTEVYLVPLWPLLAALAAVAIPALLRFAPAAEQRAQALASGAFVAGAGAAALAGLFALGAAVAYPRRAAVAPVAGAASEAWVLLDDGRRDLARGEVSAAREAFFQAAAARPAEIRVRFYLAWAEALSGRPASLMSFDPATIEFSLVRALGLPFLQAAERLRAGRSARAEISAGLALWEKGPRVGLLEQLEEFLRPMTARERESLLRAIAAGASPRPVVDVRLELARLADARGDRSRALADLAELEKLAAADAPLTASEGRAVVELAQSTMKRGGTAGLLDALIRRNPANAELLLLRAELAAEQGMRGGALDLLARVEALPVEAERQRTRVLTLYRELKEPAKAAAFLRALTERRPLDLGLRLERAELALETGEPAAAREALARAEALRPGAAALARIAAAYARLNDGPRAFELSDTLVKISSRDPGAWLLRAGLAAQLGKRAEALASLERVEALRPLSEEQQRRLMTAYRNAGEPRRAGEALEALLRLRPRDAGLRLDQAELALEAGAPDAARRALARARELAPDDAARLRMAVVFGGLRDFREAFALSGSLVKIYSGDPEFWIVRAELAAGAGERSAALESLARAEALHPDNAGRDDEQRRRIALGYQGLNEYDRALEILGRLARKHPAAASFLSDKALCEHLKGAEGAALDDLRAAIRLEPKFLPAYLTLGAIHTQGGRSSQARTVYDEALSRTAAGDADPLRAAVLAARRGLAEPARP